MYLKLTQGSHSSLFLFSNLFCPSPRLGQASWCFIILPRAYFVPFIIIYQFIQSKNKDTNVCHEYWSSAMLKPFPHLRDYARCQVCCTSCSSVLVGGRGMALSPSCAMRKTVCSFPSAAQDREHLICKISILLQAEVYILALFLKVTKTNHSA